MDTQPNDEVATPIIDTSMEASPALTVGKILSEARISQGLSVADVAGRIKFAPRQVEALEADNFERLPELAFVRGFVRSYARLLHLDEVTLLNALPSTAQQSEPNKSLAEVPFPAARSVNVLWLSAALGLLVILGIGFFFFHEKPVPVKIPETKAVVDVPVAVPDANVSVANAASSVVVSPVAISASVPPAVAVAPVVVAVQKEKVVQKEKNKAPIRLVFKAESWVDIRDKSGKTVFKQVNEPGSEQWVEGTPPFSLVIGNASGVHLYYEGDEIDLKEFTDIEVARLILE